MIENHRDLFKIEADLQDFPCNVTQGHIIFWVITWTYKYDLIMIPYITRARWITEDITIEYLAAMNHLNKRLKSSYNNM